jgi:hypothetical protein
MVRKCIREAEASAADVDGCDDDDESVAVEVGGREDNDDELGEDEEEEEGNEVEVGNEAVDLPLADEPERRAEVTELFAVETEAGECAIEE